MSVTSKSKKPVRKGETYSEMYERIFGKKEKPVTAVTTVAVEVKKKGKMLCPHCATMNLVQETEWIAKCRKCGWSK